MKMSDISAEAVLAFVALVLIGVLVIVLVFHAVPQENQQLVTFVLGALSGALTVGGAKKVADKVSTQTGNINQGPGQ